MSKTAPLLLISLAAGFTEPALAQETRPTRQQEQQEQREQPSSKWHLYLSSGLSYSHRDPENESATDYYRVPMAARISNGRFRFAASTSYVFADGPGVVDDDDDDSGGASADDSRQGFGDLNLTARYLIPEEDLGGVELDLMGRVKVPTASESKGLGTGEFDYGVGAEVSHEFGDFEPFISGQYRINGDKPDTDYRNTIWVSAGTGFDISRRMRASLAYDYHQSRIRGRSGSHYLDSSLSTRLSKTLRLNVSNSIGLSKHATDFFLGTTITAMVF